MGSGSKTLYRLAHAVAVSWVSVGLVLLLVALIVPILLTLSCAAGGGALLLDAVYAVDVPVRVLSHAWERSIDVERYAREEGNAECGGMPEGARELSRSTRTTTGTTGSGKRRTSRTRSVDWCRYEVFLWKKSGTATASGQGTSPAPSWPLVPAQQCEQVGCERPGSRRERYTLVLQENLTGEEHRCDVTEAFWLGSPVGDQEMLPIGEWLGLPHCADLRRVELERG